MARKNSAVSIRPAGSNSGRPDEQQSVSRYLNGCVKVSKINPLEAKRIWKA